MGFENAADRLRTGSGEPERRIVPTIALGGRKFVVRVASVSPRLPDLSSREFWDFLHDWPFFPRGAVRNGICIEIVGLDFKVFEALSATATPQKSAALMELKPQQAGDASIDLDGGAFYGSVLSDGSLFGELRQNGTKKLVPDFEWIEVDL
jgi:hypothetical protein